MDHLPHSFSGQSKTTHHQPDLQRRPRPSALRTQGRLSGRVLRWCSPHRPASDFRGYLCPLARQRDFRVGSTSRIARKAAASNTAAPNPGPLSPSSSQTSSTRPRFSYGRHKSSLSLRLTGKGSRPMRTTPQKFQPCHRLEVCEYTMNLTCGKPIPRPRIKPAIAGDTTCGVSLLTGTISGSNFAIP